MATILIAEDSATVRELLRIGLELAGYGVLEAGDGDAAWELVRTRPLAALVTDLSLPKRDGLSLIARIRRDPRLRSLPIVVVTGNSFAVDAATAAGANSVVLKPFTLNTITGALASAIAEPTSRAPAAA